MLREPAPVAAALRAAGCVFAEEEAALLLQDARDAGHLARMLRRRVAGEPLEHVLGWAAFCGLRVAVDPGVFVPRRRTELLAELAAQLAGPGSAVVDLCCGCGAVGATVAERAGAVVHAADIDPAAVACARRNLTPRGGHVHQGDLFDALPARLRGGVRVLAANAPYVPTGQLPYLPREARAHEPAASLDGGPDGLALHRRIAAAAPGWLAPGGVLLLEASAAQAPLTARLCRAAGLAAEVVRDQGREATVVLARA